MAGPTRRAGHKIGDHWPNPKDGLSDPQNTAKGQYTLDEKADTYQRTNADGLPQAPGKGNYPRPESESANKESISRRNRGLPEDEKGRE